MICPECQSTDVDESGTCRACGSSGRAPSPPQPDPSSERKTYSGAFELDYAAEGEPGEKAVPEWRRELSRRLREIKHRREHARADRPGNRPPGAMSVTGEPSSIAVQPSRGDTDAKTRLVSPPRSPRPPRRAVPPSIRKPAPSPDSEADRDSADPQKALPLLDAGILPGQQPGRPAEDEPQDLEDLIDRFVAQQLASETGRPPVPLERAVPDSGGPPPAEPTRVVVARRSREDETMIQDRLILLTRTLSGLVDLIIVAACALGILISTDVVVGTGEVDLRSTLIYAALLLLVFFVYSVFFLGTANQTIGMMITDIRVISEERRRPRFWQVLARTCGYLVALVPAGLGLLWGCFDRQSRCWHDRLSGTLVVRLP